MTPIVPNNPDDRALEEAMTRSRAKTMIDESKGFLVISYGDPQSKHGMFDGEFCFWGNPSPLVFLYQMWLVDVLKMVSDEASSSEEGSK